MKNYTATIECPVNREQAYKAIKQEMSAWWTPMSTPFTHIGTKAKTNFGGNAYWVFEAITLDAPALIELKCVESQMIADNIENPEEWLNTILQFTISEENGKTIIVFTHIGLGPELQCYTICKAGWQHYLLGSLQRYLTGKGGQPNSY